MNTGNSNPFQAPAARVADAIPGEGEFIPGGRRVPAGNGLGWLGQGWSMFRSSPGIWIGISVIFVVISVVLASIPFAALLLNLLAPILIGGIMIGCRAQEEGEDLRIGHLFAGFSEHAGKLLLVGLLYLAGVFVIGLVVGITGFSAIMAGSPGEAQKIVWTALVTVLCAMLLLVPLVMALWYAPALVVLHEVSPFQAMKSSFFACLKNFMPFLVYGVIMLILAVLASLPFGLGWLVLMPVIFASTYASYRDIFTED